MTYTDRVTSISISQWSVWHYYRRILCPTERNNPRRLTASFPYFIDLFSISLSFFLFYFTLYQKMQFSFSVSLLLQRTTHFRWKKLWMICSFRLLRNHPKRHFRPVSPTTTVCVLMSVFSFFFFVLFTSRLYRIKQIPFGCLISLLYL